MACCKATKGGVHVRAYSRGALPTLITQTNNCNSYIFLRNMFDLSLLVSLTYTRIAIREDKRSKTHEVPLDPFILPLRPQLDLAGVAHQQT